MKDKKRYHNQQTVLCPMYKVQRNIFYRQVMDIMKRQPLSFKDKHYVLRLVITKLKEERYKNDNRN